MPSSTRTLEAVEQRRVALRADLAQVGPMRPGSLVARYRRCGKPGCHCARPGAVGHGPSWSLTHAVAGKTVTRVIPADAVATTQHHLAEYRRFRDLVRALIAASEAACEAQLTTARAADEAAEKRGLSTTLSAAVVAEVHALMGAGTADAWDFEALEGAVRRAALGVAARAVEGRLNADHTDYAGASVPCPCGRAARYAGRRGKTITSVLGPLTLTRAYYHCAHCDAGAYPRDRTLGVAGTTLSPGVTRMVGGVGALVSFVEGHALLHELAGVEVDPKQVERTAEALGRAIAADEQQVVAPAPPVASTMYLGVDGTGVPMRTAELTGRAGKQPDGSAKTREVKLVTVWTAEHHDAHGVAVRDAGSVTYSAAIERVATADWAATPAPFAQRVDREAQRRGFDRAPRRVVLGDGAPWIWNLADELFPGAIQIVDLFHAKQHLSDVAKVIYGPGTDLARQWARLRHDDLDAGRLRAVCHALHAHAAAHAEARRCWEYVRHHRTRMRYPAFRAHGLCVSSGVVEAGCKVAIGTRLKRTGMHWTVAGANAIIALRCCRLSGRFEDFWERRSTTVGREAA